MKLIGQILLWCGFLAGALATVFYSPKAGVEFVKGLKADSEEVHGFELQDLSAVEVPVDGWHLIPWVWYSIAAAVCVAGIVCIQMGRSTEGQKSEKTEASLAEIKTALSRVIGNAKQLHSETGTLAPSKIAQRIDDVLADDLRVFADGRNSMTSEFGLNVFADVMSQFAAGERAINRAWSASADGYVYEAANCIERGVMLFEEAQRVLESA